MCRDVRAYDFLLRHVGSRTHVTSIARGRAEVTCAAASSRINVLRKKEKGKISDLHNHSVMSDEGNAEEKEDVHW